MKNKLKVLRNFKKNKITLLILIVKKTRQNKNIKIINFLKEDYQRNKRKKLIKKNTDIILISLVVHLQYNLIPKVH